MAKKKGGQSLTDLKNLGARMEEIDRNLGARINELEREMARRFGSLNARQSQPREDLEKRLEKLETRLRLIALHSGVLGSTPAPKNDFSLERKQLEQLEANYKELSQSLNNGLKRLNALDALESMHAHNERLIDRHDRLANDAAREVCKLLALNEIGLAEAMAELSKLAGVVK